MNMQQYRVWSVVCNILLCVVFVGFLPACGLGGITTGGALKPGLNYMQPMKWQMTSRYRVRDIIPEVAYTKPRTSSYDSSIKAVGSGSYEVWFMGPYEGEECRNVKLIYADPEPTKVTTDKDTGLTYYYYNLTPNNDLPREIFLTLKWEFITFERYTIWDGIEQTEYDSSSQLYRTYTAEQKPVSFFPELHKAAKKCKKNGNGDRIKTALNCYNEVLCNFDYDFLQTFYIMYAGMKMTQDSKRCWINKTGQCDEFANVMSSLMRDAGIPTRPVYGYAHSAVDLSELAVEMGYSFPENLFPKDRILIPGGHAWVEFYLPDVGWVPADPTWGMYSNKELIDNKLSLTGNLRDISYADYYFGKNDPYRIPLGKGWHVNLQPKPITPGADPNQLWHLGYADRRSGVLKNTYGWEGIPGIGGGGG